eukprot:12597494-Heterocapsa_arctica.AAC.1
MAKRSYIKPCLSEANPVTHKREKTNKTRQKHIVEEKQPEDRLDDKPMYKSDSEYTSCVEKNRKLFQNNIDQKADRDRQVAKAEEEREHKRAIK